MAPLTTAITHWSDRFDFLSPHHMAPLRFQDVIYPTLAHAWVATKTGNEQLRKDVRSLSSYQVLRCDLNRSQTDSLWRSIWEANHVDWLLQIVGQRFGLFPTLDHIKAMQNAYWLACTEDRPLAYFNTMCETELGVCNCSNHTVSGFGTGENLLGKAIAAIRQRMAPPKEFEDLQSTDCDWCFYRKGYDVIPATEMVLWLQGNRLMRRAACEKHRSAWIMVAKKEGSGSYCCLSIADTPEHADFRRVAQLALPVGRGSSWMPVLHPPRPVLANTWGTMRLGPAMETHFNIVRAV